MRGSLGHVRDQSNVRQTQTNCVPHSKTDTIGITYPTREKSTRVRNKNRPTGHAKIFTTKYQWQTHCGQKPTWWHTSSRSIVGIYTTMRINAGRPKLRGGPRRHGSGSSTPNLVHPRIPMVESLHDSCKKKQRWSFDIQHIHAILLIMLATMARPTTPMRCLMQYEQTSTHALTRTKRQQTNTSQIDYRSTRQAHD